MMTIQDSLFRSLGAASASDMPIIQPAQGGLSDRAVLLSITISSLGTKRKVASSSVEVDADKSMVHVSKDILQSEILDDLRTFDGDTRKWISVRSLPSQFRSGVYLWPIGLVLDADDFLRSRTDQRNSLVERFMQVYLASKIDAQQRLGVLYNPMDYPNEEKVRSAFAMSYQFIECSTPGRLQSISPEMFERERAKAESQWRNALDEAREMLRSELAGMVEHMADRMKPGDDGKPKRFKSSLIENFNQFLTLFDCRNLANDNELAAVVQRCREVLNGSTAELIRDSETMRSRIAGGMESIKADMQALTVAAGRRINLEREASTTDDWGDI